MNIKNYTSTVTAANSMANIEKWLIEIGATDINKKYENKICRGITYLLFDSITKQTLCFKLKAQVDECFNILWKEVIRPKQDTRARYLEQANKTAWKILSDWTEIQCSMILLGQATPLQMFLPFVYDPNSQETLYDRLVSGKQQLLLK